MLTTTYLRAITEIPAHAWNALCEVRHNPFVAYEWLEALETAGCVGSGTDWQPRHITLWRGNELVAAAPAYIKNSSEGDFSRDWAWADAAIRSGLAYYPKLVIGVPFTPVTGQRFLIRPDEPANTCIETLLEAAVSLARRERCNVLQVLYCQTTEACAAETLGWERRIE